MKRIFLLLLAAALTACNKDDPKVVSPNSYTFKGVTTPITWGGFYYNEEQSGYCFGLCKHTPEGQLHKEDEYIEIDYPEDCLGKTRDITINEFNGNWALGCFAAFGGNVYAKWESEEPEGIESGTIKITRTGTTNEFSVVFSWQLEDGSVVKGNYKGVFTEYPSYEDVGVL